MSIPKTTRTFTAAGALLVLLLITGCSSDPSKDDIRISRSITPDLLRRHVFFLASDSLKGRDTPSPGLDTAAAYIAGEFARSGVRPINGSYFQKELMNIVNLADTNTLRITSPAGEVAYTIKTDFTPFEMTSNSSVTAHVVFAGYGITAPEYSYDDYAGIDVRGRIVFVLRHEPGEEDTASVFEGKKATDFSNVATKARIAFEHGAAGVMVATDPLNHRSLVPRGFPWPSLSRIIPKDALPLTLALEESTKVPVVHVGESVIAQLFGSVDSLRTLQAAIDASLKPHSFPLSGVTASIRTSTEVRSMSASNVVGIVEGQDSLLRNEAVIIGAHYDHVGFRKNQQAGEDSIYNGADDNASGTSGMLAVASAFGRAPQHPKRSVLFLAFAGEEKGIFGSTSYVRHPLFPLENTVAMINLDMIGRNGEDSVYAIGGARVPEIMQEARAAGHELGLTVVEDRLQSGGSDHISFLRKNIPSLFFFGGLHPDYHRVTDNPETVNPAKAANVARLAFLTAWRLANDNRRYRLLPGSNALF